MRMCPFMAPSPYYTYRWRRVRGSYTSSKGTRHDASTEMSSYTYRCAKVERDEQCMVKCVGWWIVHD